MAIDDHQLVAAALTGALRGRGYDARACPVLDDGRILGIVGRFAPEVVLLDLSLGPDRTSLALIEPLQGLGARVVMLTATTDPLELAECVEAGADGLLSKGMRIDDVVAAIEAAADDSCAPGEQRRVELLAVLEGHREQQRSAAAPFEHLTKREQEVLAAIVAGHTAQTIATDSFTSVRTVRGHIQSVLDKLGVRSQVAAVAKARDAGWQPDEPADDRV